MSGTSIIAQISMSLNRLGALRLYEVWNSSMHNYMLSSTACLLSSAIFFFLKKILFFKEKSLASNNLSDLIWIQAVSRSKGRHKQ